MKQFYLLSFGEFPRILHGWRWTWHGVTLHSVKWLVVWELCSRVRIYVRIYLQNILTLAYFFEVNKRRANECSFWLVSPPPFFVIPFQNAYTTQNSMQYNLSTEQCGSIVYCVLWHQIIRKILELKSLRECLYIISEAGKF